MEELLMGLSVGTVITELERIRMYIEPKSDIHGEPRTFVMTKEARKHVLVPGTTAKVYRSIDIGGCLDEGGTEPLFIFTMPDGKCYMEALISFGQVILVGENGVVLPCSVPNKITIPEGFGQKVAGVEQAA